MASFRESVRSLKEAGLADSEILKIISDSVDGQLNGSLSIPKPMSNISLNVSGHELPKEDIKINVETPSASAWARLTWSVLGKRGGSFRSLLQSTGFSLSPIIFCFSANMDEDFELAEKALNGEFPDLPKRSTSMAQIHTRTFAESSKVNKKTVILKKRKFYPKR